MGTLLERKGSESVAVDGPLEPFKKGFLNASLELELSQSFPNIGDEVLILPMAGVQEYYAKLIELTHEHLLRPLAVVHLESEDLESGYSCMSEDLESGYSCICFEDHLSCMYDLGNLLFFPARDGYDLSALGQKYIFEVAKTLNFLHKRNCYHGHLKLENIYLDNTSTLKIASPRGPLNTITSDVMACSKDLHAIGDVVEDLYKMHGRSPSQVVTSYIKALRGDRASDFLFNHQMWLCLDRKISLILEMEASKDNAVTKAMQEPFWPTDERLQQLITKYPYPHTVVGFLHMLRDKYTHPSFEGAYEECRNNFGKFLEEIEKRDPEIWMKMLYATPIDLQLEELNTTFKSWFK